jgi:hypothetical protein
MAGRRSLIDNVLEGLNSGPGDPNRATIFVGARGTGKTALLAKIAEEAEQIGWVKARVTAGEGMLEDIIERIQESAVEFIEKPPQNHITGIGAFGVSITRDMRDMPSGNWRTRMNRLIDSLNAQGIGILITVDEVNLVYGEMRTLATTFQHFVTEQRNVALLMAGLPHHVSMILQDKTISFLRRAVQRTIGLVGIHDAREVIKRTIELSNRGIDEVALNRAAEATGGFPFLIQLIGYHVWRQHPDNKMISVQDVSDGIIYAKEEMNRAIFEATLAELSDLDRKFLYAMAEDDGPSKFADIAARMNITSNQANQYRRRLIGHDIIGSRGRGLLDFEIPMLRDYLRNEQR